MLDTRQPLNGQVAVITGGGRGIGAAIAGKLAAMGAAAVLCGRTPSDLEATAKTIIDAGGRAEVVACDVQEPHQLEHAAARVQATFGRADILVNNAGVGGFNDPLHMLLPEDWDRILNTNLRGVYYAIRAFAPMMIQRLLRTHHQHLVPGWEECSAQWRRLRRLEVGTEWPDLFGGGRTARITTSGVSVVCPGSVDTDLSPHAGKDHNKMLQPEDVAHAVAMLVTQAPQSFVSEILLRPTQKP